MVSRVSHPTAGLGFRARSTSILDGFHTSPSSRITRAPPTPAPTPAPTFAPTHKSRGPSSAVAGQIVHSTSPLAHTSPLAQSKNHQAFALPSNEIIAMIGARLQSQHLDMRCGQSKVKLNDGQMHFYQAELEMRSTQIYQDWLIHLGEAHSKRFQDLFKDLEESMMASYHRAFELIRSDVLPREDPVYQLVYHFIKW